MISILFILLIFITLPSSSWAHSPPISSSSLASKHPSLPINLYNSAIRRRLFFGSSNKLQKYNKFSNNNNNNNNDFNYYKSSIYQQKNNNFNKNRFKNNRLNKLRHLLAKAESESTSSFPSWYSNSIDPLKYFHYQYQHNHYNNKDSIEPTCEELRLLWSIKQLVLLDEFVNNNNNNNIDNFNEKNKFNVYINKNQDDFNYNDGNKNDNNYDDNNNDDKPLNEENENNSNDNEQEILKKMLADIPKEKHVYITKIEKSDGKEHDDKSLSEITTTTTTLTKDKDKSSKIKTEAETVSPYGIVHNSPTSERRGSQQSQLLSQQPSSEAIGFFGEFFENFYPFQNRTNILKNEQNLRNHYQNDYNFYNEKMLPSNFISYINNNVKQQSRNHNKLNNQQQNLESMFLSLPSSSLLSPSLPKLSSSSSKMTLPGFWHEKPVKPSVNLIN